MMYDLRTAADNRVSFYVVDHLPTMKNLYRFDTVEEAIDKFNSLSANLYSAIGGSIDNRFELDIIHRRDGKPVLVMDTERIQNPVWRENQQVQDAIDYAIAHLNVQHQLSFMFGDQYVSSIVDLERYSDRQLENYFQNKLLRPTNPGNLLTAINEVHVEGSGWLKLDAFLKQLAASRPKQPGKGAKANFVTRLNIGYIDETGRTGQADLSTLNFKLLQEKTAREVSPEKLAEDLFRFACDIDPYEAQDQADIAEAELAAIEKDIASGNIHPYIKKISELLEEGLPSEEDHKKALSLLSRLTVLTPREFRKTALVTMIRNAGFEAKQQFFKHHQIKDRDRER